MGTIAVLSAGWQLYVRLFWRSLALSALVYLALVVVLLLPLLLLLPSFAESGSGAAAALLGAAAFTFLLYFFGLLLIQGALTEAVCEVHASHEESSVVQLLATARDRLGALAGAWILMTVLLLVVGFGANFVIDAVAQIAGAGLALLLGLVGVGVVAVWVTRWAVVLAVVVIEEAPPRHALARSAELVRGSGWKVFWTLICSGLISGVGGLFVQVVVGTLLGAWLAQFAVAVLTAPYISCVVAAIYFALADPNAPIVPNEDAATWQSVWVDKTL